MQNRPWGMSMFVRAYLRASTQDQDARRAKADLEKFAAERGLKIAATYVENESGAKLARPELFRLLADAQPGDMLLVEQVDRLSRLTAADWERLKSEISARKLRVVALDLPTSWMMATANSDDFTGRMFEAVNGMMLDVLAAVARKDYEDRRRRQAQGQARAKAEGRYKGRPEDVRRNPASSRCSSRACHGRRSRPPRLQPRDGGEAGEASRCTHWGSDAGLAAHRGSSSRSGRPPASWPARQGRTRARPGRDASACRDARPSTVQKPSVWRYRPAGCLGGAGPERRVLAGSQWCRRDLRQHRTGLLLGRCVLPGDPGGSSKVPGPAGRSAAPADEAGLPASGRSAFGSIAAASLSDRPLLDDARARTSSTTASGVEREAIL